MRLAEHAHSPAEKTRLVTLAEGWVELAEKAHKDNRRTRQPTILHPLVEKKMGSSRTDYNQGLPRGQEHTPLAQAFGHFGTKASHGFLKQRPLAL
jgi:hypothetical protein